MQPGRPERIEFEYTRHGTVCLFGNCTDEDFCQHIFDTVHADPQAGQAFVVDQLNIHCSEALVRYVARLERLDETQLGGKGRSGILKSMATRQAFLSDRRDRVRFVYLPKHSSWLSQVETIFGILQRRVLRRGSFRTTTELKARLLDFIRYFNETFVKPSNWTFTGRPVKAARDQRPKTWKEVRVAKREARKTINPMAN